MAVFGRKILAQGGYPLSIVGNGKPKWRAGGITIDWGTVPAAAADTQLVDGTLVRAGQVYLRYGTVLCQIDATGLWGPYDAAATDGRQNVVRNKAALLTETLIEQGLANVGTGASSHPGVIEGGGVWKARLLAGDTGQPSFADLQAALPLIKYIEDGNS